MYPVQCSKPTAQGEAAAAHETDGVRIILSVDDNALVRKTREIILQRAGYGVISAVDGEHALSVFQRDRADLVLLDYVMPGMDGGRVAHEMRRQKPGIPIVMVSASVLPEEIMAEVDCSVMKGEGPESLLVAITSLLRRSQRGTDCGASC